MQLSPTLAPITASQIQGAIETFWSGVYSKNIGTITALLSPNFTATYQVTIDGKQQPEKKFDFQGYISELKEMFIQFQLALTTDHQYTPSTFTLGGDKIASWMVNYNQQLQTSIGTMYSTGTQTWSFDGTHFTYLQVVESDVMPVGIPQTLSDPTVGTMQGAIESFWGAVYSKDIKKISALISPNLSATYQVTVNGAKQPEQQLDFNAYIADVQGMFSQFELALTTHRAYDPGTFSVTNGQATWSVNYLQNLKMINGVMASTGQQTWTFNGTQFVALAVTEIDTTQAASASKTPTPTTRKCALVQRPRLDVKRLFLEELPLEGPLEEPLLGGS